MRIGNSEKYHKIPEILLTFFVSCITMCNMVSLITVSAKKEAITTARLPADTRNKLLVLSKHMNKTKSEIIKEAVEMYYEKEENEIDSYTLGLPYFGKYNLGAGDLSTTYKERIREKLRERQNSY